MGRQGWAFCFGLLVTAAGLAQPPSDDERYPPPPDLPGEVVSQPAASRSIATVAPMALRQRTADPAVAPLPKGQPATYTPTATATIAAVPNLPSAPVVGELPAAMGMFPSASNCAPAGCGTWLSNLRDWCTFRSKARPPGCYPSPYTPPLQAWFPCDPKHGGCGPKPGCAMPLAPMTSPFTMTPSETLPAPTVPKVGALPAPNAAECPDKDVLSTFRPVSEGIGFAPGAAPMANPTTQIKQSTWRPR